MVEFQPPTLGDLPLFLTLLALELVLSFDNAAILAALSNRLPKEERRKALLYGLVGAYVFRVAAIFIFVVGLFTFQWVKVVGAGYLLYLAIRHIIERGQGHEEAKFGGKARVLFGLSAFWSTVVYIELADVAFALDQILVAIALAGEERIVIIIAASLMAIIFLRISAYYIGRVMEWFPPLETLAYIAVGFVGLKMMLEFEFSFAPWLHYEIPAAVSIAVTFGLIILPPLGKYLLERFGLIESKPPGGDGGAASGDGTRADGEGDAEGADGTSGGREDAGQGDDVKASMPESP